MEQKLSSGSIEVIGAMEPEPLTVLLIKTNGLHEGFYELAVSFDITGGYFGFNQKLPLPGIACVLNSVGLTRVVQPNERAVDAAVVNPAPATKAKPRGGRSKAT